MIEQHPPILEIANAFQRFCVFCMGLSSNHSGDMWYTEERDLLGFFFQTTFVWTPLAFLLAFAPLDIYFSCISKYSNIPWGFHNIGRLLLIILLLAHAIADFTVGAMWNSQNRFYWVTPSIRIVMFTIALCFTLLHRKRGITSSGLMTMFWLLCTMLAIPQLINETRGYHRRINNIQSLYGLSIDDYHFHSFTVQFVLLVLVTLFHLFADKRPSLSRYQTKITDKQCPELHAGFIQRILYLWLEPTMWKSYRQPLIAENLFDVRPEDMSSNMNRRFEKYWKLETQEKSNTSKGHDKASQQNSNANVIPVLFKTFGRSLYLSMILKLLCEFLSFVSPQILSLLITFILNPTSPMYLGFTYAIALLLNSLICAFLQNESEYLSLVIGSRTRATLINAVYCKSLTISSSGRCGATHGEVVNLMSVDAQVFKELYFFLHFIWSGPLVLIITSYFLYDLFGLSGFAGLGSLILLVPVNGFVASKLKYFQEKQMQKKDERIRMLNEILGGMKVFKLYAWETSFQDRIKKIREKELQIIYHASITNAFVFLMWSLLPFFVTLFTFVAFVFSDNSNKITPNAFFVALSLFNILRVPLIMFPLMVQKAITAWVAVQRINKYLNHADMDFQAISHDKIDNDIEITDGNFAWGSNNDLVLQNICLTVGKGHLAAIVGPVGCGKSSLILSLLGETTKNSESKVNIHGSLAYVAQEAWIYNATVQDNILFGLSLEPVFYQRVLEACALLPDLEIFPAGDQTEIGERGINLSGGQKQRVALARAVYCRADIYLLDDPLSAVDAHVGKHIFERVIGPAGLLAKKTRLLVTHSVSFLQQTNTIFVMTSGRICEIGNYLRLLPKKGAFADFLVEHVQRFGEDDVKVVSAPERALVGTPIENEKVEHTDVAYNKVDNIYSYDSGKKLIKNEDSFVGSEGLAVYFRYFRSVGPAFAMLILTGVVLTHFVAIYSNAWLATWSVHPKANEPETRFLYLVVYAVLGVLQGLMLFLSSMASAYGSLNSALLLHDKLLYTLLRLPMSFFDTTPLGRIANRFTKDIDEVDNRLPDIIQKWLLMATAGIGIITVISITTPITIAAIVPLSIVYYFIQRFFIVTARQLRRIESVSRSPIFSHFGETIKGRTTIRAFGMDNRFRFRLESLVDENQKSDFQHVVANRWLSIRLEIIGTMIVFLATLFAVLARDTISSEMVGMSIAYAMQLTWTITRVVQFTADMETSIVAIERLEEYSNNPLEAAWESQHPVTSDWPTRGALKFENVDFRYREGLNLVLRGVSFDIIGGEKIGIVGRTGSGKSSLTLALFRIVEAAGGRILIDDVPISKLGLQMLRSRITIIPQDPVLFGGSLRGNLDPFGKYSDDEVWASLERSHLKSFVNGTSSGLMHEIDEGGENLSLGQRQLICLARALLRKSKLLILDEATAAIDLETDLLIQTTIREEFKECTVLTIAHRLNTILDSDRVLVLVNGMVKEFDQPHSLLNNPKSIFYGLARDSGIIASSVVGAELQNNYQII